jgi:hypothetical protein
MSPTLINESGYRIHMYTNDHKPPHVHVKKAENEARVQLDPVELMDNRGYNPREIKAILELVQEHQTELLAAWNTFFPPESEE